MRMKIYQALVNRQPGISYRYHRFHDKAHGMKKVLSWFYLLGLNFCYYILFCRFLGERPQDEMYEQKRLLLKQSESEQAAGRHMDIQEMIQKLIQYDVISFDIFDTLLFRPFSEPTDLFFFMGERLGFMDFKRIRIQAEREAREECKKQHGHTEITLEDIWERIQQLTGISAEKGMELEQETERQFCYANPYMLQVYQELKKKQKKIILISDMYLSEKFLKSLLEEKGFLDIRQLYVSCEHGCNKAAGGLYTLVKNKLTQNTRVIHVGDNPVSDVTMAEKNGMAVCYYPNVNENTLLYRPYDMSPVIGGAYRGIVNNYLYSGMQVHGMEYEYGFVYGGLFVLGYCNFIHEYCHKNQVDKVLFLSRDGDILKQVYDRIFPEEKTEYVYWSRAAATKLMAAYDKYDYFRRYLHHKVNQGYTLEKILLSMELKVLLEQLPEKLRKEETLTDKNVKAVIRFLEEHWTEVLKCYEPQQKGARLYYAEVLKDCSKVCAVDIGWAGSGPMALRYLTENVWKLPCQVVGLIAGTNTIHNTEPDASEMFLQSGKLVSYLYSRSHNYDLMKKHDPGRNYNVFWELLLSSPTPKFQGFYCEKDSGDVELRFGKMEENPEGIREIQQGILDFAEEYQKHFGEFPYMRQISGRDAYAPMLLAAAKQEAYLKTIAGKFNLDVQIG